MCRSLLPLLLVLLFLPKGAGEKDVQWERLIHSDFEAEGVLDPPEGGTLNAQEWKWYPEGLATNYMWKTKNWHCIEVTTEASHSGTRSLKFHALPRVEGIVEGVRCAMAAGSDNEDYWGRPRKEYLQYYFYILPEFYDFLQGTEPGSHALFVDIEIFDGSYDAIALIHFDIWGNMARMAGGEHTPRGTKGQREIVARNQFALEPATWYRVRLEADHGDNRLTYFSLEGPGLSYERHMDYELANLKQLTPELKALGFFLGVNVPFEEGYAYNPTVLIDDVEGGIEVTSPVTTGTTATATATTLITTPTTVTTTTAASTTTATGTSTTPTSMTTTPTTTAAEGGILQLIRRSLVLLPILIAAGVIIALLLHRRGR